VIGLRVSDRVNATRGLMIGARANQIKFPDKQMKVGDTFAQQAPMTALDLKDVGIDKDFDVNVTYKLTAIKDGLAYFDTIAKFEMDLNKQANGRTFAGQGAGGGSGKMIFDIAKSYPRSAVMDINISFDIEGHSKKGSMTSTVKLKRSESAQYAVTDN
jgi:hypothetical protein